MQVDVPAARRKVGGLCGSQCSFACYWARQIPGKRNGDAGIGACHCRPMKVSRCYRSTESGVGNSQVNTLVILSKLVSIVPLPPVVTGGTSCAPVT